MRILQKSQNKDYLPPKNDQFFKKEESDLKFANKM
jgi:hypothetical protein